MKRFAIWCATMFALVSVASAAHAAPPLETYGRLPGFEMAAISPSGKRVAIITTVGDQRKLVMIEDEKAGSSITLGDYTIRTLDWAGDDRVLLRASQTIPLGLGFTTKQTEISRVFVIEIGDRPIWEIFNGDKQIGGGVRGYHGSYERGGVRYGYFGGITLDRGNVINGRPELYEVDLDTHKSRRIALRAPTQSDWRDWVVGPDGTVVATMAYDDDGPKWTITNTKGSTLASGRVRTGLFDLISLGRTPDTVLYSLGDEEGEVRFLEQPLAGGPAVEILSGKTVARLHIDRRTGQLIGYVQDGDVPEDHFFDPRHEKAVTAARKAFPGRTVTLVDRNEALDRSIIWTSGPGDPGSWWLLDSKARTAKDLGTSYSIAAQDVGSMRMIHYTAADGLDVAGVLTLPPGRQPKNLPVIVMPHDGPEGRDYPVFDWRAQAFASRGYAVFQPNFRGSSGFSSGFIRAGWGEWGNKMQSDISDGLTALGREGVVDPKRACIVGSGYGGYAALAGVTLQQGIYRCAVSVAGVSDVRKLTSLDANERGYNPRMAYSFRKELRKGRDLDLLSPIRFAAEADAPVMLIHGATDMVVPYRQSADMATFLSRAGKSVELVKLPGDDHWMVRSETRLTMLKAAVGFVEKHNPPDAGR